jgi:glutamate transport system substrate-binding protein
MSKSLRAATVAALAIALPLSATACGGGSGDGDGKLTLGTKFDQPGLAMKNPNGTMSGFDVDVATYVAKELGYSPEDIEWKEAPSAQRETLIQNDQVDYIVATYSITDSRKEKVDFAGPYFIAGQGLLVRTDNTDITGAESLQENKKLCSVSGSTPAQRIKDEYRRSRTARSTQSPPTTSSWPGTPRRAPGTSSWSASRSQWRSMASG